MKKKKKKKTLGGGVTYHTQDFGKECEFKTKQSEKIKNISHEFIYLLKYLFFLAETGHVFRQKSSSPDTWGARAMPTQTPLVAVDPWQCAEQISASEPA